MLRCFVLEGEHEQERLNWEKERAAGTMSDDYLTGQGCRDL